MANTSYDVILRFLLDEGAKQKTKAGVDQLTGDIGDVEKITRAVTQDFERLEKQIKAATSVKELDSLERQLQDVEKQVNETTKAYSLQARTLRAEAASLTSDFEKARVAQIKSIGDRIGRGSLVALGTGTAILGGAFAESNRFAKEAEDTGKATAATREWTRATQELAQARARVDTVLLRQTLPLLQQAARIANQAAEFVEKNPEIVSAALKAGEVLAALGAVGIAVSKGIRLYADVQALALGAQELAAAKLQDLAADKQLVAARLRGGLGGAEVPGGGAAKTAAGLGIGAGGAIGVAVAGQLAGGAVLGGLIDKLGERLDEKLKGLGDFTKTFISATAFPVLPALQAIQNLKRALPGLQEFSDKTIGKLIDKITGLGKAAEGTANQLDQVITGLAGSAHESEIVSAFEKWKEDDARIVQEAAAQRIKITQDAEKQITASNAKFTKQVASINASADQRAASLTSNFLKQSAQDEARYQENRAKLIRDGGKEIREIEADHQERLRKLTQDHNERVEDLTASRDALGLVKEQRRFNAEQAEENRNTRIEIAKRRADLAERLAELDHEHEVEQAQRLAQFQEALAENEAQRKEQLQAAAKAHAEELAQIRAQRAQQLRELQEGLNAERLRRREAFLATVRDLDAALLGEKNLKARYYNLMLADADKFLAAYRAKLASATTAAAPAHDFTGYAYQGIYRMAANGQPEYVLSGAATRAAENIIRGGLTQDALLTTLARGAGNRTLTYNDQRRIDASIPLSERRAMVRETVEAIAQEIR